MSSISRGLQAYISACVVAAAGLAGLAMWQDGRLGDDPFDWGVAIGFGVLFLLSEQFPVTIGPDGPSFSVSFVLTIAAVIAAGAAEVAVAILFGTVNLRVVYRPVHRHAFNAAQLVSSAAVAGLVYTALGGPVAPQGNPFPGVLVPLAACTLAIFAVNTWLVSGAMAISEGKSALAVWRRVYAGLGRTYVAFALLGLLLGVLYSQLNWLAVLFVLVPLLVARRAFQAAIEMQSAYDSTVRSLIKAIEAKDPYTSGHAERVSRLSEMTARAYGLPADSCRLIRYAALMHDIGKLGVLNSVLQKPGKLTPEEYEHMKQHPLRGVEIVGEIDLLQDALAAVRHHHERLDGHGYPDGLRGEEIPLFARLIMVSDAFDSMTSTRTYRRAMSIEQAVAELRRCAGTQFDPRAIDALEGALQVTEWVPAPEPREETEAPQDARTATI